MNLQINKNVPLKKKSTFNIGGNAKYYIEINSINDLLLSFNFINENKLSYYVIGNGSNILFDDKGYSGVILHIKYDKIHLTDNILTVGAGNRISTVDKSLKEKGFYDFTAFAGIPATIGGAVYMNAGCFKKEISQRLKKVVFISSDGAVTTLDKAELDFSYRSSIFHKMNGVIIELVFELERNPKEIVRPNDFLEKRKMTQPTNEYSIGSIFKNPPGFFAGEIIERAGLKNYSIGDATISSKHANFIINKNLARAKDVLSLIKMIKKVVKDKYNIDLQEEINYLRYESE